MRIKMFRTIPSRPELPEKRNKDDTIMNKLDNGLPSDSIWGNISERHKRN